MWSQKVTILMKRRKVTFVNPMCFLCGMYETFADMKIFKSLVKFFTFLPVMQWHGELAWEHAWQEERKKEPEFPFSGWFCHSFFFGVHLCPLVFQAWLTKGHIPASPGWTSPGNNCSSPNSTSVSSVLLLHYSVDFFALRTPSKALLISLTFWEPRHKTHPTSLFPPWSAPRKKKHIFEKK